MNGPRSFDMDAIHHHGTVHKMPDQLMYPMSSNGERGSIFSSGSDGGGKGAVDERAMRSFSRECLDRRLMRHHITGKSSIEDGRVHAILLSVAQL